MKVQAVTKRTALALSTLALLLSSACNRTPAPTEPSVLATDVASSNAPAPATDAAPGNAPAPAAEATTASNTFDIEKLPVSTATLGEFPYIGLPDGYQALGPETNPFARVPFWTGDRLEWVEGQVYGARIEAKDGYSFSHLEVSRNLQALVESLGGRQVFSGKIPYEGREDMRASNVLVDHRFALGDIHDYPVDIYVIRRSDRNIWLHTTRSGDQASLLIAETKPVRITAKALPAVALKKSLDADGKVAIQVQFETDQATLLPSSKPQLEQVVALSNSEPDLRLSINGHTDNTGNAAHNLALSQRRAAAVRDFIVAAGVDQKRLESSGFGDTQPVADNTSEESKARNRRVELMKL